jgi:Protoglobin
MKMIDEPKLEAEVASRFQYLTEFMGFDEGDIAAIHGAAPLLAPLVPTLVDAVYNKLNAYSSTWRHFLPRQYGYEGVVPTKLEELTMDHPQIAFRKQHLGRYLANLVTKPYDGKMIEYLDVVGKIHTPKAGNRNLDVPLVQMNALMGFVSDALVSTIVGLNLPRETEVNTLRAFNKLLWLQNDLITRHYQTPLTAQTFAA